ncbi:MAG TPA: maleylpyruvate isomerase N-terminal domain-containing protein, partial [Rhodoglobus sp.]|nr:maleylpyruvate isomerase N-terminal domain-containing protein [Rhodoglobus sp.]
MNNLDHLTRVTGAFLRDVSESDPVAPLADIRWTVADLAAHLGEVHRWAAGNARTGARGERQNVPELSMPLANWYGESRDILLTTL